MTKFEDALSVVICFWNMSQVSIFFIHSQSSYQTPISRRLLSTRKTFFLSLWHQFPFFTCSSTLCPIKKAFSRNSTALLSILRFDNSILPLNPHQMMFHFTTYRRHIFIPFSVTFLNIVLSLQPPAWMSRLYLIKISLDLCNVWIYKYIIPRITN